MTDHTPSTFTGAFWSYEDVPASDSEDPEQLALPGMPVGFLAYQINYRCVKGCTHTSVGTIVDGGGRGGQADE